MKYLEKRRRRREIGELLRHARFVRNMREDVASADDLHGLAEAEEKVKALLAQGDTEAATSACEPLEEYASRVMPQRRFPLLREYVEIFAVALGVAMGCRAYFIQPYKIPTGSMQPTLYGITHYNQDKPGIMDRMPLKLVKWLATGEWYVEVRAKASGRISKITMGTGQTDNSVYDVGGVYHEVPRRQNCLIPLNSEVKKGDLLWAGIKISGDHVFVNRLAWHYRRPRRSEVSVFQTGGIDGVRQDTHYIKRLVGLPGDSLEIREPHLFVNGKEYGGHEIGRIAAAEGRGYRNPPPFFTHSGDVIETYLPAGREFALDTAEYAMFGDNTSSSHDSRYWGSVPEANLVGPAWVVYWPFMRRSLETGRHSINSGRIRR